MLEHPPQCGSPLGWHSTGARRENKYVNPKAGHVTLQSDPALWTLFLEGQCGFHTHHETQVKLPSWSPLPPPSLFLHLPSEEHMSPITVLLSQHTIKAERQTSLLGLCFSSSIWQNLLSEKWLRQVLRQGRWGFLNKSSLNFYCMLSIAIIYCTCPDFDFVRKHI